MSDFSQAVQDLTGQGQQDAPASSFSQAVQDLTQGDSQPQSESLPTTQQNSPTDVSSAQQDIGNLDYNNLCEKFVEQKIYGKTGIYPTAIDAWTDYAKRGLAQPGDISKAPAGSMIFFYQDNSNGNDGHVALTDGNGNMIGATTSQGIQESSIADWIARTGQKPLGFVPAGGGQNVNN